MITFNNNTTFYFNQQYDNYINNIECLSLHILNNKLYLTDSINNNIKIVIMKKIDPDSNKGKNILFFLGYNIDNSNKIILKCRFTIIKSCIFNKYYDALLIITSNRSLMTMYKYKIYKKNMVYNNVLMETTN